MDEPSMVSDLDFRALPPLPESPIAITTTTKAFPSSPFQIRSRLESRYDDAPPMPSSDKQTTYARHAPTPRRSPNKQPQTQARIPSSESQADNYLPTSFLLRSPSKHLSPAKIPLPPSPTRPTYALPSSPIDERRLAPSPAPPAGDVSFLMPQNRHGGRDSGFGNLSQSMIADMSMPDLMSLEIDESLEFGPGREMARGSGLETAQDLRDGVRTGRPTESVGDWDQQPAARPDPSPTRRERSPVKTESRSRPYPTPSARSTRSPLKPLSTASPSKTKRTFPASSSSNMLSRLGEEAALDVSTLYPRTPTRMAYLMEDEHQLLRQSLPMSEGDSVLFAPSPPPVTNRKTPRKASTVKDPDMTMDVAQMMARMGKPKRPSGTEESFEDLLHGTQLDLDDIMFTGDILPPDLRPRTKSLGTHFQARSTSASVKTMDLGKTSAQSPAKDTARGRSSPAKPLDSPQRHMTPAKPISERSTVPHPPTARRLAQAPTTRRPSLSAGAIPLPTTASCTKMELPKPAASRHERTRSAVHPADVLSGQRQTGLARPRSEKELPPKITIPAPRTGTTASARSSAMLPPPRPTVPRAGSSRTGMSALPSTTRAATTSRPAGSMAPPASRPAPGSMAPPASRPAPGSMAPPARPGFRPTSMAPPAKSSLPPTSTRTALPGSTVPRPGLTRPSASATRAFGADGTTQTNRTTTRPAPGGLPSKPAARAIPGKMSMAPTSSPSKRETASSMKSRAASTPADTVAWTLARPTTTSSKLSIPPVTSGSRLNAGTSSALPRPASRLPAPGTKLSSGAGTATAAGGRGTTSIASLRARIDEISARQAASRRV